MTFFVLLLVCFGVAYIPPLARLLGAPTRRDRMRVAAGLAFILASIPHFTSPERYLPMMPPFVPAPEAMIVVSGVAELIGGVGMLIPRTARIASWWLALLLLAIFPANVYVAIRGVNAAGLPSSPWYTWSRLPFQALFVWWVLYAGREAPRAPHGTT